MRDCFLRNSLIYFKHDITTILKSHYHSQNLIIQLWQWSNAWLRWPCSLRTTLFHFPLSFLDFMLCSSCVIFFLMLWANGDWILKHGLFLGGPWYGIPDTSVVFSGPIMGASELFAVVWLSIQFHCLCSFCVDTDLPLEPPPNVYLMVRTQNVINHGVVGILFVYKWKRFCN